MVGTDSGAKPSVPECSTSRNRMYSRLSMNVTCYFIYLDSFLKEFTLTWRWSNLGYMLHFVHSFHNSCSYCPCTNTRVCLKKQWKYMYDDWKYIYKNFIFWIYWYLLASIPTYQYVIGTNTSLSATGYAALAIQVIIFLEIKIHKFMYAW
jgi:hypothetical protein